MVDWKSILKWAAIIFVILFIIGAISDRNKNKDNDSQVDLGGIADNLDFGDDGQSSDVSNTQKEIETTTGSSDVDLGLTEEEINQLEADLNDLQIEDLGGLE